MNCPRAYGLRFRLIALGLAAVRRGLHDTNMSFVQKPFTAENLAMHVRKVPDAAA